MEAEIGIIKQKTVQTTDMVTKMMQEEGPPRSSRVMAKEEVPPDIQPEEIEEPIEGDKSGHLEFAPEQPQPEEQKPDDIEAAVNNREIVLSLDNFENWSVYSDNQKDEEEEKLGAIPAGRMVPALNP